MSKEIVIVVKPDGSVEVDAVGFSGSECLEATMPYEKVLGTVSSRKKKPEFLAERGAAGVRRDTRIRA